MWRRAWLDLVALIVGLGGAGDWRHTSKLALAGLEVDEQAPGAVL